MGTVDSSPYRKCGDKGAAAELLVCADLLSKGFHVYRAVSPCAQTDLVVIGNNGSADKILLIEVKSTTYHKDGTPAYKIQPNQKGKFDVLAMMLPDGRIIYEPENRLLSALSNKEARKP
jgi:Holliday junction resolvase-like predicted endonuclease